MNIVTLTKENLEHEHICCAIASNKDCQVATKKAWLSKRLADGLVFKKAAVRGKVFIEYMPAEKAWCPINAEGYMFINCLWVSGQYKGQGLSSQLLNECIIDSKNKGKKGLVIVSSDKKMPYLADRKYLEYKGFQVADTAQPYYQLMYLPFEESHPKPCFKLCAKEAQIEDKELVLYYSSQCPFTAKYVPLIKSVADEKGITLKVVQYETAEKAQSAPVPSTTYSLFYRGEFITHEILSVKKFEALLIDKGLV